MVTGDYFFEIYSQYGKDPSPDLDYTITAASKSRYYLPVNSARHSGRPAVTNSDHPNFIFGN